MSYDYRDTTDNVEMMEGFEGFGETYDREAHEAHDAIIESTCPTDSQVRYRANAAKGLATAGVDMFNRVQDVSKLSPEVLAVLNSKEYSDDMGDLETTVAEWETVSDYQQALDPTNDDTSDGFTREERGGMYAVTRSRAWRGDRKLDDTKRMVSGNHWKGTFNRFDVKAFDRIQVRRKNAYDRVIFPFMFSERTGKRLAQSTFVRMAKTERENKAEELARIKAENDAKRERKQAEKLARLQARFAKVR